MESIHPICKTTADEVVILLSMSTSFNGFDKSASTEGLDSAILNQQVLSKLSGVCTMNKKNTNETMKEDCGN